MVVYITTDVRNSLNDYRKALRRYPISRQRAHEKYNNMVDALLALGKHQIGCSPCVHKKLGQVFDSMGKPVLKNLYRFNYSDESKYQWAFALIIDNRKGAITITKMVPSRFVTERKSGIGQIIKEVISQYLNCNIVKG